MTEPSDYFVGEISTNQTALDTLFGNGNYAFTIVTAASTQQATVDLPASLALRTLPTTPPRNPSIPLNPSRSSGTPSPVGRPAILST